MSAAFAAAAALSRRSSDPKPRLRPIAAPAPSARLPLACRLGLRTDAEAKALAKVGRRVRVKVPLKAYHVTKDPKYPKLDLLGMEGVVKQYVGVSANSPFKVVFVIPEGFGRSPVKFVVHLREDDFECLN